MATVITRRPYPPSILSTIPREPAAKKPVKPAPDVGVCDDANLFRKIIKAADKAKPAKKKAAKKTAKKARAKK